MITNSFLNDLETELEGLRENKLFRELRTIEECRGSRAKINGKWKVLFCGNDYLGLSQDSRVIQAFKEAAKESGVGSGAARLISGTSKAATTLESFIAKFKKKQAALTFSSGYLANLGIISALCNENDVIIVDKLSHACILDGAKLSGAKLRVYPHNNVSYLEKLLNQSTNYRRILIVTDSVFSMDGDLASLSEIVRLKNQYGALLMIDEAHGTGVFGKNGRGVAEYCGVEHDVDISMGTMSKAIGTFGGFVAGERSLINYLINHARSFLFSTALPPAIYAASACAINIIETDQKIREKLWANVQVMKCGLKHLNLDIGDSESPIMPVVIGDEESALSISKRLFESGFYVPAIRYPTVPKKKARLRITVSALHSNTEIEEFLSAIGKLLN